MSFRSMVFGFGVGRDNVTFCWIGVLVFLAGVSAAFAETTSRFTVTDRVVAPAAPPISATIGAFGEGGRLTPGGNFEPSVYRNWFIVSEDAPLDAPGEARMPFQQISYWDTLRDGALDGAEISVMRLSDGKLHQVREGRIAEGGYDLSGWIPALPGDRFAPAERTSARVQIADYERPGVPRWYAVRAFDADGRTSSLSPPARIDIPARLERPAEASDLNEGLGQGGAPDPSTTTSHPALSPPEALNAVVDGTGRVELSWTASPGATGYQLFMSYVDPAQMEGFRIQTEGVGDPIRAGDLLIVRKTIDTFDRESFISDRIWNAVEGARGRNPLLSTWPNEQEGVHWSILRHPEDPSRGWGGRSYLQVEFDRRAEIRIGTYVYSGIDQDWYEVLHPDTDYTVSVRLRGIVPGQAWVDVTGPLSREIRPIILDYGTDWTEAVSTFRVPRLLEGEEPGEIKLVVQGPGTIDVDDFRIHRADTDFLDYPPEDYDRLAGVTLSALRTHAIIKTGTQTYDLANLLGTGGFGNASPGLPETLRMIERTGISPWLQVEPHLTDAEWLGLIEYLAAPFDPTKDDAAELPWAAMRVAQGRAAPWTNAFDKIYFEIGNETWNGLFAPWVFPAMKDQATGRDVGSGQVYGLFQNRVVGILRSSPWWGASALEDKVSFVIGGWSVNDYGEQAAAVAPDASDLVTIATYNGGWDEGEGPPSLSKASLAAVLNQVSQVQIPTATRFAAGARDIGDVRGYPLDFGTYEAGPGYALNGLNGETVTPEQQTEQERVMKSTAAGVATLDSFLAQRREGFSMQNFFTFGEGEYWRSHARWYKGGGAYPSWQLTTLLGGPIAGEMLEVTTDTVETRDLPGLARREPVSDAPQIAVYALREDKRTTVVAISRKVAGYPDVSDDGCAPVEIALPFDDASTIRMIRTVGSPTDNGYDGTAPDLQDRQIDPNVISDGILSIGPDTGGEVCGMPPASARIYVIEDAVKG
ncbi:hypothetical protein MLD63_04615 [Paracoccus sp. TK19116]|uniref:Fibronectin type-III domain-containing protein n=1 Tax=Paracoccus albicereus TaxID=2922394 RepID=A0ABT1MPT0_9RHOB|nr:hypothetical protein [Paracoccus albicereus]MCQ0969709.1 hypothetical protein [Paracoccus albicereus]